MINKAKFLGCLHRFGGVALFVSFILLASIGSSIPASALNKGAVSNDARLGGDSLRTRFVADLSRNVPFRVFVLSDPYRVIVDLPNVDFQMPSGLGKQGRGLVSAFRFGQFARGKSRIVIDVNGPFRVDKSFILKPVKNQPARLVIDIVPTDARTFITEQGKLRKRFKKVFARDKKRAGADKEIAALVRGKSKSRKPVVVVDPGHGGADSGAVSVSGIKEKNITLEFSKLLAKRLRKTGQFEVHMTRKDDRFIELRERTQIARRKGAGLLISIHCDSLPKRRAKGVRGATVYTLSEEASDDEAKALAASENSADILWGVEIPEKQSEVKSILIDLAQRETKNDSIEFANMLLGGLKGRGRLNKKPHRSANLRVLRAPDVPAVLLELGYLSSKEDEKLLNSKDWQGKMAGGIVRSVKKYFANEVARR